MSYWPNDSMRHHIAAYNFAEFKKMALGFGCADPQHWYDMVSQTMLKLSQSVAQSPVPQGVDPLIQSISRKAESMPPAAGQSIADLVDKINKRIEDDNVKYDVLCLLKETQPSLKIDGEKLTIDADTLDQRTVNALILYLKAHN
jgi:hypothetical protein